MKIAFFDSGVDISNREIDSSRIIHAPTKLYKKNAEDNIGHGTAVAYALSKNTNCFEIVSYKLFDENYLTTEEDIIEALEDVHERFEDVKVINISSGVTYISQYNRFYDICEKLRNRGCCIVAAYDNNGRVSYPAAFDNTIGVYWDERVGSIGEYIFAENALVEILGYAGTQRLPWKNHEYNVVSGSSFIAPYVSAKIFNYCLNGEAMTFWEIRNKLRAQASYIYTGPKVVGKSEQKTNKEKVERIKKAIAFPCNKEIHALLGNKDLLGFQIEGVFDYEYSRSIGVDTGKIIHGECVAEYVVKRYGKIDWEKDFDTVIVGHLEKINSIMHFDYLEDILKKCYLYKKNCFFFDDVSRYRDLARKVELNGNLVMSHLISDYERTGNQFGSYYRIPNPTLAVVGTSSGQGKYNVQLCLRRRFLREGYDLGQVSTEPSGHLFGMDICFSNGYGNKYCCNSEVELTYMNKELFGLREKEIIILGTQSQLLPLQFGNLGFLTFHQQNMLLAMEPDVTILCVNYDDDFEYIHRCVLNLKYYYQTDIIAMVVFPFSRQRVWDVNNKVGQALSLDELTAYKGFVQEQYNVPCFVNGNEKDMDCLYRLCVNYFSEK